MAIADRKLRDREAQRRLIVTTARTLAEREGWDAVTTRRLAAAIEYSQPVIYKHFTSMDDIAEAVAVEGFRELADALAQARAGGAVRDELTRVAHAYRRFAEENPALYDAMFSRATGLPFGGLDAPEPLADAFAQLSDAIATVTPDGDREITTEVFWAALHGLTTFERTHRLPAGSERDRVDFLVSQLG